MTSTPNTIRWGILGTGSVAKEFARGLQFLADAQLLAVASGTVTTTRDFASQFHLLRGYASYRELVNDPEIDVVYVATPHSRHKEDCILCLEAGKAVLCEKPFAVNAREAREVIDLARQRQLFCMEAMWMRFMPLMQKVRELANSGTIGDVRSLTAEFGYPTAFDPDNRFFNAKLGGGALLDRGIYLLSLAFLLLGEPTQAIGQASMGKITGVDEQSAILLNYSDGKLAILYSSLLTYASNAATITGTRGKIQIHEPFYRPEQISITQFPEEPVVVAKNSASGSFSLKQAVKSQLKRLPFVKSLASSVRYPTTTIVDSIAGNGYNYEAAEVMRCLRRGDRESKIMPLDETLRLMETMDGIRQQWNLKYPQD